jgi:hypothetical protein
MGKVVIVDALTGEVVERAQTVAEKTQSEKDKAEAEAQADALEAKQATRQAVLDKLGLTADEAQALLG